MPDTKNEIVEHNPHDYGLPQVQNIPTPGQCRATSTDVGGGILWQMNWVTFLGFL
jgi:hypothetical protein